MPTRPDDVTIGAADEARTAATPAATSGGAGRPQTPTAFAPGAIIAGRYRLVALLGRGGMGEVYRADDLTLDQPVALKFLPAGVATDDSRLAQFHNELRVARQVSHKNVVRLYDLGDADGRRFLTMEYVDGEDLGSLLRRIGRIPQDKALELARQLCAGVSAAHERGVLHRDLKPANVMIDGDGNVRITDFGIATAGADEGHTTSGTPQYMAPEQLAGKGASIRTDIYALGLVLFEIFTGRRAYDAKSLGDLKQLHDTGTITTPSSIVRDIEPAVERVILRCLARDPDQRPSSALTVAASLPGGDPLAAALAAGETPSPAMLVAAGESEALGVGRGLAAVALVVIGLAILIAVSPRTTVAGRSPLDKPPAVLIDRAQQILASVGYTEPIADSAYGFSTHQAFLRWIATTSSSPSRWDVLRAGQPSALLMWYRTSPRLLATTRSSVATGSAAAVSSALVSPSDPPMAVSGMTSILLDSTGRMIEFQAVPPQVSADDDGTPPAPAWKALFDAAGLDMSTFTPATPQWSPRDFADTRAAWEGPLTGHLDYRVRIEAAAYRGRPTSMLLLGPWSRPTRMATIARTTSQVVLSAVVSLLIIALTVAGLMLARFNLRAGRADRRGATRLALFVMVGNAVMFVVTGHHLADVSAETNLFTRSFGGVLIDAGMLWIVYLALEPYVRRLWPDGILGWTRLLSGYIRDPRVGRDLLTGCVIGTALGLLEKSNDIVPPLFDYPARLPTSRGIETLAGAAPTLDFIWSASINSIVVAVFLVLGYVVLRLTLRRTSLAVVAAVILLAIVQAPQALTPDTVWWIAAIEQAIIVAAATTMVVRYGLLVTAVALTLVNTVANLPLTYSLSHWTATTSNLTIALALGLALFGFYASRAGQPIFGKIGDMANG